MTTPSPPPASRPTTPEGGHLESSSAPPSALGGRDIRTETKTSNSIIRREATNTVKVIDCREIVFLEGSKNRTNFYISWLAIICGCTAGTV